MGNYAGVDWAAEKHDVLVADESGEELLAATFAHDEKGLRALCRALVRLKVQLVAIERPDGLLVERLLDAGLRVLALHPNQVAAARARFRVSGGKSDRFDAFVICELARTDHHRFRVLEPDSDQTKALRALTRAREDLVHAKVALSNQLRAELERFWPGPTGLFSKLDSQISLAFLERYPSPADARGLGEQRLQAFLSRERYSGRQKPAELLAKLRRAAEGRVGEAELAARRALVLGGGRGDQTARRSDQAARPADRDRATRPSRRRDLPVAVQGPLQRDLRRGAAVRDRRLPRALPNPRHACRRRRPSRRRDRVRQT
jgi:transposase